MGDIETVLITGAGASYPFGTPLMTGWCESLVAKLSGGGYRRATGLSTDLPPEVFEERLGQFLHRVQAFNEIKELLLPTLDFQQANTTVSAQGLLEQWHHNSAFHLHKIIAVIRESLYELFANANLDVDSAAAAYRQLFELLGLNVNGTQWVYATTNYDVLGETVISRLGGRPDWGELPHLGPGDHRLDVDQIIEALPRSVPVLHLHGRVGWYRSPDRGVYASNTTQHHEDYGVPIVMLPDLNKAYADDGVISSLWAQFTEALRRTKRVFVLGHSLHDAALINALQSHISGDRIMVAVLAHPNDPKKPHPSAESVVEKVMSLGGSYTALTFGEDLTAARDNVSDWINKTAMFER